MEEPLEGVPEFFALLRRHSVAFILVTNNASKSPELVQARMASMGVDIRPEEVLTSGQGAAAFLRGVLPEGAQIYVIGENHLREALSLAGFRPLDHGDSVEAVVVGLDAQLTWSKLTEATRAIAEGALFIGANPDPNIPVERGLEPGTGAILAALQAATGRSPTVVGKPEPHLFQEALKRLGSDPTKTWVVGDRLETDILGGQRAGLPTVLILTGVTRPSDLKDSDLQPDWVYPDLPALTAALAQSLA